MTRAITAPSKLPLVAGAALMLAAFPALAQTSPSTPGTDVAPTAAPPGYMTSQNNYSSPYQSTSPAPTAAPSPPPESSAAGVPPSAPPPSMAENPPNNLPPPAMNGNPGMAPEHTPGTASNVPAYPNPAMHAPVTHHNSMHASRVGDTEAGEKAVAHLNEESLEAATHGQTFMPGQAGNNYGGAPNYGAPPNAPAGSPGSGGSTPQR